MKINLKTTSLLVRLSNCKKTIARKQLQENNCKKNNYKKNNFLVNKNITTKHLNHNLFASIFIIILSYFSEIENQIVFKSANIFYTKMIRLD